jgi:hypothetical protein
MASLARWRVSSGSGGGTSQTTTHLLLSGGKLGVPESDAGAFLNAYALAVVRGERPCVVEIRTPLFGYFVDLDIRVRGEYPGDSALRAVCSVVAHAAGTAFETVPSRVVACRAGLKTESDGSTKVGVHLHWPGTVVSSRGALAVRDVILTSLKFLASSLVGFEGQPWDSVVDAAVYKGSGLRMAWSGKYASDERVYAPWLEYDPLSGEWAACEEARGVAAIRDWVGALSVRVSPTTSATPLVPALTETDQDAAFETTTTAAIQTASLGPYASVLPLLDSVLPLEFTGQRFVGLVKTDRGGFMLRSTSRYCLNLGRAHRSNNVYFVLTRDGISQRCYCRCETTEGRRAGLCRKFVSETWPVPPRVSDAFFPDVVDPNAAIPEASMFVDDEGAESSGGTKPSSKPSSKPLSKPSSKPLSCHPAPPAPRHSDYGKMNPVKRAQGRLFGVKPAAAKRSKKK